MTSHKSKLENCQALATTKGNVIVTCTPEHGEMKPLSELYKESTRKSTMEKVEQYQYV